MKKITGFAALLGGAVIFTAGIAAAKSAPKILRADGEVFVRSSGSETWRKAETGELLPEGAGIRVEPDAECDVRFEGEPLNVVSVRGGSEAVIASVDPPVVDLKDGRIFALLNGLKPGSVFKVRSAVATAAARGTGWSQTSGGGFSAFIDSIQIETPSGAALDLDAGLGVEVGGDGDFGETHEVSDEERNEFDGWTDEANGAADAGASGGGGGGGDSGGGVNLNELDGTGSRSDGQGSTGAGGGDAGARDARSEGLDNNSLEGSQGDRGRGSGGGGQEPT